MLNQTFSTDKINTGRQPEIDMARCISGILMIICHTGIFLADLTSRFWQVSDFIGGEGAAPVFMFCMGLSFCYSKNTSTAGMIKRGGKLILIGFVLNLVRIVIPMSILKYYFMVPDIPEPIQLACLTDVLFFAGLAMIVIALFNKLNIPPTLQLFIAILLEAISEPFAGVSTGSMVGDLFAGFFLPISAVMTPFALLSWLIFPVAGQLFGHILLHCTDKSALYRRLLPICGLITLYVHIMSYNDLYVEGSPVSYYAGGIYYGMGVKASLLACFVVLFMISLSFFLQRRLPDRLTKIVSTFSRNLNPIYITSWILIAYTRVLSFFISDGSLPNPLIIILMPVFVVLSYVVAGRWKRRKSKE